ncbi:hypothetical protein [Microbacterium sp. gxy059]|uniref:hypothetical protein n=1 Tax=Microbacterium sp. gxy059 TaxID=2957199 RepID=UPI003D999AA5
MTPPPVASSRRGRRRAAWLIGAVVLVVVAVAAAAVALEIQRRGALERIAEASSTLERVADLREDALDRYAAADAAAEESTETATAVLAHLRSLVPDEDLPALESAERLPEARVAERILDTLRAAERAEPPASETDFSALREAADAIEAEAADAEASLAAVDASSGELEESAEAIDAAVSSVSDRLPEEADRVEAENISAEAPARIALQKAARAAEADPGAAEIRAYVRSASAVRESQEAEMAEKDRGGLLDARLEVEEFARSIVGDVRIDFDWAPIVNGLGEGESAGGYTTWWYADGGYATIELSDSVAAFWPDERFRGLVAHETGHAATARCREVLEAEPFSGDVELLATAWAIGKGFDDPWGNGVDYYYGGVPPEQAVVEAALACG